MARLRVVGNTGRAPGRMRRLRLIPAHLFLFLLFWAGLAAVFWPSLPSLSLPTSVSLPGGEVVAGSYVFRLCGRRPYRNCVIDGDTFYFRGESIRLADIDAPETNPPRCAREAALGAAATERLRALLADGPFEIRRAGFRDTDRYGRKLRTVERDGRSLGAILVSEGLARQWTGRRLPWCG